MTRSVLYVSHEVGFGGAERSLLDLFRGLDRTRYRPVLATSGDGPLATAAADLDVPVHHVPMLFANRIVKFAGLLAAARSLRSLAAREAAALIHTNTAIAGYCGLPAARLARIPLVWHLRDIRYPDLARRAAAAATVVIANSRATAATLPRRCAGACRVIYNGVSPAFFDAVRDTGPIRAELRVPGGAPLVGMVGRLEPWKGHGEFLQAAARIAPEHPNAVFVVVGGVPFASAEERFGGYGAELGRRAAKLGISDRVRFLGHRPDVVPLIRALAVLVHPSREPEPFGRAIAEAQAAGRPVVATRVGGIPEIVEDGANGLLVPPRDPHELARAVGRLLADPALAARLGDEGRRRALGRFTAERHAEAVTAVYGEVLGDPEGRR